MRYNTHGHIFDFKCVPERFIPILSKRMLDNKKSLNRWVKILHNAYPFSDNDDLDKYSKFIRTMGMSQEEIYLKWASQYPKDMKLNALTMDLRYMGAGFVEKDYIDQLKEAIEIKRKHKNMMLSIMIDPRANDLEELYTFCYENGQYIDALKMYPLVGYTVNDRRLDNFYELCDLYGWPVIVHGTPENAVHCRNRKEVKRTMPTNFPGYVKSWKLKTKCGNYAHPYHIIQAAKKHPNINFDIAHFHGGWMPEIINGMQECKNLYSDISFTFNSASSQIRLRELMFDFPILKERLLFGDDSYMILTEDEQNHFTAIENIIGRDLYDKISIDNPKRFFNIK
jgi:predicted TIM-barrel fold metal-dependent hydrolase